MLAFEDSKCFPKVSIIIATHNRAEFLREAINSVLVQSFKDFELIIIDDGSTDDTQMMVSNLSDQRIKYFFQHNQGRSVARNAGIRIANGRYITFLDSDDLYLSNKLDLQVNYLDKHPETGMIYTSAHCIDSVGNFIKHKYMATLSGFLYNKIAFFVPLTITLPTVMIRREILLKAGAFDDKMHRFEDTDMWRRISKLARIDAIADYTCKLRTHSENVLSSQDPQNIVQSLHYYAQKILNEDNEISMSTRQVGIGNLYYHYASAMKRVQNWDNYTNELLRHAYRYRPIHRVRDKVNSVLIFVKTLFRGRLS